MKISASIYSYSDTSNLEKIVKDLDLHGVDCFHIDCNENLSVFDDIKTIRKHSSTPIDLHIIAADIEPYIPFINELKIEYVQFQLENLKAPLKIVKNGITRYGLGIVSSTPFETLEPYINDLDFVLLMTTIPGESGGKFNKENFQRIRSFRNAHYDKALHVDGGVNHEVSFILRNMGVSLVVSGSFIAKNKSIGAAMLDLRVHDIDSHFCVKDFMIDLDDLPVLNINTTNPKETLQTIEQYKLGFTCFINTDGTFAGLTSNADYRKGLLKNISDFNQLNMIDIVNQTPVSINEDATITDMLKLIKSKPFLVSFLPVLNSTNKLTGAVTFFNLIRSES